MNVKRRSRVSEERMRRLLREQCEMVGSQKAFARRHNFSQRHVNDVIHGRRTPGPAMLEALNLQRCTMYAFKPKTAATVLRTESPGERR